MHFFALVALAVVASFVPSLAAPTPYFPRRVTSERDPALIGVNALPDPSVRNGFVKPSIGPAILPGANLSPNSKRDTNFDIVQAIDSIRRDLRQTFDGVNGAGLQFEGRSIESPSGVEGILNGVLEIAEVIGGLTGVGDLADLVLHFLDEKNRIKRILKGLTKVAEVIAELGGLEVISVLANNI